MSTDELTSMLRRAAAGHRTRAACCPEEERIAAYVDGGLGPVDSEQLELHLADCEACIAQVGLLSRQRDAAVLAPVPETAVARARGLVKAGPNRWTAQAPRWAAAAMVIVTVSAVVQLARVTGPGDELPPGERTTRSISTRPAALQVLYPSPGMTVDPRQLVFRWEAIPGSRYYQVRIVSESGDLISEQRVANTEWRPSGDLNLSPGVEYFVHVDAYPSEAKTISSDHIRFGVSDSP